MAIYKNSGEAYSIYDKNSKTAMVSAKGPTIFRSTRDTFRLVETIVPSFSVTDYDGITADKTGKYILLSTRHSASDNRVERLTLGTVSPYGEKSIYNTGSRSALIPLVGSDNSLYITDYNSIFKYSIDGTFLKRYDDSDNGSHFVIYGQTNEGKLVIVNDYLHTINLVDSNSLAFGASISYAGSSVYRIVYDTQTGIISSVQNGRLNLYDGSTLALKTSVVVDIGSTNDAVWLESLGNRYIVYSANAVKNVKLFEYSSGTLKQLSVLPYNAAFYTSANDGRFWYVCSADSDAIYKVDRDGKQIATLSTGIRNRNGLYATESELFVAGSGKILHYHQF